MKESNWSITTVEFGAMSSWWQAFFQSADCVLLLQMTSQMIPACWSHSVSSAGAPQASLLPVLTSSATHMPGWLIIAPPAPPSQLNQCERAEGDGAVNVFFFFPVSHFNARRGFKQSLRHLRAPPQGIADVLMKHHDCHAIAGRSVSNAPCRLPRFFLFCLV